MPETNCRLYAIIIMLTLFFASNVLAVTASLDNSRVLAVIPVAKGNIDQGVYRQFDRLVPELKSISKDKIIKLECRYAGKAENEQDVLNAYQTASRIEKYLRVHHKLGLDLWITIRLAAKKPKSSPVLTIAVLADDIKNLNSMPADADKSNSH